MQVQLYTLLASVVTFAGHASGQLIGAQFAAAGTSSSALYSGTGVLGESFVPIEGSANPAYGGSSSSTGVALAATALGSSGVSLAISYPSSSDSYPTSDGFANGNGQTAAINLYNNFLYQLYGTNNDDGLQFTFSGLTPGGLYNLAAYSSENGNTGGIYYNGYTAVTWTVGVDTTSTTGLLPPATPFLPDSSTSGGSGNTFALGVNYVTASEVVADTNGDIVLHAFNTNPNSGYDIINGLGIEAVPEPSTWAMLIGGLGLLLTFVGFRSRAQSLA